MSTNGGVRKAPRVGLVKKLLFSAMTTVSCLALIEFGLGLLGFVPVTATEDPFVGFSNQVPLMEVVSDENGTQIVKTSENKLVWFNAQSFPLKKGVRTRRVFCMGGSTTYGHPYWDSTSFARWLREYLPVIDPNHQWEVINAGGISYASYRVAAVMDELSRYQPDLFIVYSVHNEFLERRTYAGMFEKQPFLIRAQATLAKTRLWAALDVLMGKLTPAHKDHQQRKNSIASSSRREILPGEVDEILNHTTGPVDYHRDPVWRESVLRHYEANLERMVAIARRCGAKIVFITPASNEKNCSPFKSEFSKSINESQRREVLHSLELARQEVGDDNHVRAIELLKDAIAIDPSYAEIRYRLGQSLFAIKQFTEAQQMLSQALNEDVCPLRGVRGISEAVWRVGKRADVAVVDFEAKLRDKCRQEQGHSILGEEYFLDHVHPTIDVNRHLALWIIEQLLTKKWVQGKSPQSPVIQKRFDLITEQVLSEVDEQANGVALRNLAKVIHWSGKYEEAAGLARNAMQLIADDPESRFVLADCLKNLQQYDAAIDEYDKLFSAPVNFPKAHNRFGEVLAIRGHYQAAKAYLLLGVLEDPKNAYAQYLLAQVHFELGEFDFAQQCATESDRLEPNQPSTLVLLARAQASAGKLDQAVDTFERAGRAGADTPEFYNYFGLALMYLDRPQEAIGNFQTAVKQAPEFAEAQKNLQEAVMRSKPTGN